MLLLTTWRFYRGDGNFSAPSFDDSSWRKVDIPHDYSAEDLPTRDEDESTPVLAVRSGSWRFFEGLGSSSMAAPDFDDSTWRVINAPADWHSQGYTKYNATAWFRRRVNISERQLRAAQAGQLRLALGPVASADVTYVNGKRIGAVGTFFKQGSCAEALDFRSYGGEALASAIHVGTDNVVAVQAWSAGGPLRGKTRFIKAAGALPSGGDVLPPKAMPVEAAVSKCNVTAGCLGITFRRSPSTGSPHPTVYFKAERVANGDARWQSFVAEAGQPGGLVDPVPPGDVRLGPFDAGASPGQKQTGYTVGGMAWYRRDFATPSSGTVVEALLEGCYMRCRVWLNGEILGAASDGFEHPYGYTQFAYSLPSRLLAPAGQSNTLAVRVNNSGSNSRWYSGSGLFRPVRLLMHQPLHIVPVHAGGVYVTTPNVRLLDAGGATANATASFRIAIRNAGDTPSVMSVVRVAVRQSGTAKASATGSAAVPAIAPNGSVLVNVTLSLKGVRTWSPDQPALLEAAICLANDPECTASYVADGDVWSAPATRLETFGVRTFSFNAEHGLRLNGVPHKLRGGCVHHDNGPLGSRAIPRAEERKIALLKASGYNAIRTSHNPPSRAFVDACDRLGVILMVEAFDTWRFGKNPSDYHVFFDRWWQRDLATMVLRDRNSPSILMWSIGNEIGMRHTPEGAALSRNLSAAVRALDDGGGGSRRAVTSAYPGPGADAATDAFLAPLDIAGYNYAQWAYDRDHARVPSRVIVATETFPVRSVEEFQYARDRPFVVGNFIWTAIDYIGESSIGAAGHYTPSALACGAYCAQPFPWHVSSCGDLDIMGDVRAQGHLRRVMWGVAPLALSVQRPGVEVIGAWGYRDEQQTWTWPGLEPSQGASEMVVRVYAPGGCVSVTVNGVPAAGLAGDGEPSSGERTGAAYRRWRRRLQQRLVADCVNVSTSTKWQTDYTATFLVPYEAGELRATMVHPPPNAASQPRIASAANGAPRLPPSTSVAFRTAGPPASLRLTADQSALRASRDDLAYVRAEVVDAAGVTVHCGVTPADGARRGSLAPRMGAHRVAAEGGQPQRWADDEGLSEPGGGAARAVDPSASAVSVPNWCAPTLVSFAVEGAGELAAVGSGDPTDLDSFGGPTRKTYRGKAYAVVRPGQTGADGHVAAVGTITVSAQAAGLKGGSITLRVGAAPPASSDLERGRL